MSTDTITAAWQQFERIVQVPSQERQPVEIALAKGRLQGSIVAADSIGFALEWLRWSPAKAPHDATKIRAMAERLSDKIRYLVEPLALIEIDADDQVALVRSNPPSRRDNAATYYELRVAPSSLELRRYRAAAGDNRQAVPMQFTSEVLQRLMADFMEEASRA